MTLLNCCLGSPLILKQIVLFLTAEICRDFNSVNDGLYNHQSEAELKPGPGQSRQMKHSVGAHSVRSACVWILDQIMCELNLCVPITTWTVKAVNELLVWFEHALPSDRLLYWWTSETFTTHSDVVCSFCRVSQSNWDPLLQPGLDVLSVFCLFPQRPPLILTVTSAKVVVALCSLSAQPRADWFGRIDAELQLNPSALQRVIIVWFNFQCFSIAGFSPLQPETKATNPS